MYSGYGYTSDYQDTGERQSKKARRDWDAPGATAQYTHGYQDSGYTSSSTNYAGFSPAGSTSYRSNIIDSGRPASGRSGNKSFSGRSEMNTFSQGSGVTNWYGRESGSQSGSAFGQTQNFGGSSYSNLMKQDLGSGQQNQAFSSRSTAGFGARSHASSGMGQTQNYDGSSYSNLIDDGFSQPNQAFSSHSAAFVKPGFDQTDNSGFGRNAKNNWKSQSVQSTRPADSRGSVRFGDIYEEQGDSRIGGGYGSQHGRFKKETRANFESARNLNTSQNRGQQRNSNQNRNSNWESQRNYGMKDFDDTRHHIRSSTSGSLRHDDTRQGHRSVLAQGEDEPNFETDLAIRMAAEIQQRKQGKVDVNKILKVMKIVDQMSESEEANINQGFVGGGSKGIIDKPSFGVSQDFLGMRGSSGRQESSSSWVGKMNMMKQGVGMGLTGQGSQMGVIGQRGSAGMMGHGADMGMIERDTSRSRMGHDVHMEMTGQRSSMNITDEYGGMAVMGPGSGRNMAGQIYGMGMTGRESRNRTRSFDQTFRGNPEGGRQYQQRVPWKQRSIEPRSLMDMHVPVPDNMKKYAVPKPKLGSQLQPPPEQLHKMSLSEKFRRFLKFLKNEDLTKNVINLIDNAVDKSRLGLQKDFKFEPFLNAENKEMLSARLLIEGIFLARTSGMKKKDVKRECYEKALHLMTTKSAGAIMKQKDHKKEKVAKEKMTENENDENCEFRKKIAKLQEHLKSIKTDEDDDFVTILSDAMTQFGLEYSYSDDEETKSARGVPWFVGNLKIGDLHVGVGSGPSKKYAKKRAFSRATYFFKTKELFTVMQGVVVQERDLIPEFEVLCEMALPNSDTEEKLARMIDRVLEMPEGKPVKLGIEDSAKQSDLRIILLFKNGHKAQPRQTTQCDLFVDKIFISSGEAFKKAEAESQAYQEALTVLCSSSADVIFNDFKRMSREDAKGVMEMAEIWSKGRRNHLFFGNASKVAKLKAGFNDLIQEEEEASEEVIDKDEIIIMEKKTYSVNRKMKAYEILHTSACMNLMLLQGKTHQYGGVSWCNLFLQHMKVGKGYAPSKKGASSEAAMKALFRLYQTQPTIGIEDRDEIQNKFSYETMKAKADALKAECGETGDDDYIYIASDAGGKQKSEDKDEDQMEVEDEEQQHDESPTSTLPVNKWLKQIIEEMIMKFASEESLEEIIFCGEFPPGDQSQIRRTAKKYNVDTSMYSRKGLNYIVVYQKYLPAKILEILQKNDGHLGLYSIIPKEKLPKPSDIESLQKPAKNKKNTSKRKMSS